MKYDLSPIFWLSVLNRFYLPPADVRTDLLTPTETTSICPYKGLARYWSARVGEKTFEDIVWSYPDPLPEQPRLKNRLCFFNEKVELLEVDGEP